MKNINVTKLAVTSNNAMTKYQQIEYCDACVRWTKICEENCACVRLFCTRHHRGYEELIDNLHRNQHRPSFMQSVGTDINALLDMIRHSSPVTLKVNPVTGHLYDIPTNKVFLESKRSTLVLVLYFVRAPRSWNDLGEHHDQTLQTIERRWLLVINYNNYEKHLTK